jgi:hypothetical protein
MLTEVRGGSVRSQLRKIVKVRRGFGSRCFYQKEQLDEAD